MSVTCPSCGSHETIEVGKISAAYLFASHNLDEMLDGGSLFTCETCYVSFRHPRPAQQKLDDLYRTSSIDHWQYDSSRRTDWLIAKEWLNRLHRGGTVLDVGCYDGAFLDFLGSHWDRYGIEINEKAAQRARERGIRIVASDLRALNQMRESIESRQFDALVAFDVIEHVPNPQELLLDMAGLAQPGGTIILASGNRDAFSWQLMGSSYWYCTIPEHLAFISTSWCREMVRTHDLELLHLETYSHEQNRTIRLIVKEWASNLLYRFSPNFFARLRRFGMGDKDTRTFTELAYYPPTWTTARDHLIAVFRKA